MTEMSAEEKERWLLAAACIAMLGYMAVSRTVRLQTHDLPTIELWLTTFRVIAATFFFFAFRPFSIPDRIATPIFAKGKFLLVAGALLFLITPAFWPKDIFTPTQSLILALTAIPVGFSEELFFRGIVQRWLAARVGLIYGILITCVLFIIFHFGITAFSPRPMLEQFTCAMILGLVYAISGRIWLPITLHAIYDFWPTSSSLPATTFVQSYAPAACLGTSALLIAAWARMNWNVSRDNALTPLRHE